MAGLEPATTWLTAKRSTTELHPNNLNVIYQAECQEGFFSSA